MKPKCSSCPINRKKKPNYIDKALSWGIKIVLIAIVVTAAYEQFIKEPAEKQSKEQLVLKK